MPGKLAAAQCRFDGARTSGVAFWHPSTLCDDNLPWLIKPASSITGQNHWPEGITALSSRYSHAASCAPVQPNLSLQCSQRDAVRSLILTTLTQRLYTHQATSRHPAPTAQGLICNRDVIKLVTLRSWLQRARHACLGCLCAPVGTKTAVNLFIVRVIVRVEALGIRVLTVNAAIRCVAAHLDEPSIIVYDVHLRSNKQQLLV